MMENKFAPQVMWLYGLDSEVERICDQSDQNEVV